MHRLRFVARSSRLILPEIIRPRFSPQTFPRCLHTQYEDKYSEKLRKVAEERGLSISELKAKIKLEQEELKRQQRDNAPTRSPTEQDQPESSTESARKDSSPVKPLSSILNIPRILASPHTAEQISALWTVYHASRSNGTGRGYLSSPSPANPQTSTVMFTPLQEYKMRGSFATPTCAGVDGRYLLRQEDAHRLSMSVRNFYLWDGDESLEREKLVKAFHESPNEFEWEKLLKHAI
ncbi:ATP11-domain-containing protein [Mycena leptocephala]|nr:ATP11-domain-containing protein [Mycena leptocephala]